MDHKNKQARVDATALDDAGLDDKIQSLETIQEEIEKLNDEATEEILQVERKFNSKRKPYYKRRNEIIKEIPDFWVKVFTSHEMLTALLDENDKAVFQYLRELNVEDHDDVKSGYKISLTFDANPYFKNPILSKEFRYDKDGTLTVIPTAIEWKEGKDLTKRPSSKKVKGKRAHDEESESFFTWFSPNDQDLELAEIIKEDLWPNPAKYYLGIAEEDDEAEEDPDEVGQEGDEGQADDGDDADGDGNGEGEGEGEEGEGQLEGDVDGEAEGELDGEGDGAADDGDVGGPEDEEGDEADGGVQ